MWRFSFPCSLLRKTLFAYKRAGLVYLPSVTGREVSTSAMENALFPGSGQPGDAVQVAGCKEASRGAQCHLLFSLDPPLGTRRLSGVTALVILSRVAGTKLPLQVERIEGEGREGGRGTDAQTDGPGRQLCPA